MAREPDWLTEWAYIAQWFVCPITFAGWLLARFLTYVFGVSMWEQPGGYVHILLIGMNSEFQEFVPPWLAYLYNGLSVLLIVSIALVIIGRIAVRDRPQP
jgi:hypothetical protein